MDETVKPHRIPTPLKGSRDTQNELMKHLRERTVETLQDAFEQGVMTLEEYEERISLATTASTEAELNVLTADMSEALATISPNPVTPQSAYESRVMTAVFGSCDQEGFWTVVPRLKARSVFGQVQLDFTQVEWVEDHAQIDCKVVFGSIRIVVPDTVQIECNGIGIFGEFNSKLKRDSKTPTHRLRISGHAFFGSVEIVRAKKKNKKG